VHFTDPTFLYVADDTYYLGYGGCLIACLQGYPDATGGILATLPAGVRAVGIFGYQYSTAVTVSLTAQLNSGESITQGVAPQGSAFFGFTSTSDISTVSLKSGFDPQNGSITRYPTMRQFEFGSTASTPEPSAAPGIAGALLALGIFLRRRDL